MFSISTHRDINMVDTQPAQTSAPDWMRKYCRQLADIHYDCRLGKMYIDMLESFLKMKPYKAKPAFPWYVPNMHASRAGVMRQNADLGWVPLNMVLPVDLVNRMRQEIDSINLYQVDEKKMSLRTYLYTAAVWWCSAVHPYKGLQK